MITSKSILLLSLLFVSFLGAEGADAVRGSVHADKFEMPGTAETRELDKANVEIGKVYGQLLKQMSTERQEQLRKEQRQWIQWRDQEVMRIAEAARASGGGGSGLRVDLLNTRIKLVRERTEVLRKRLPKK